MEPKQPSLLRILQTDYPAFAALIFPLFGWGFVIFDLIRNDNVSVNFILVWSLLTIAAIILLIWRIIPILNVFHDAQEVTATISDVSFFRDRGYITFIYWYQGGKWLSRNLVLKNRRTTKYATGDTVTVFVDRNKPKRAYIMELFQ